MTRFARCFALVAGVSACVCSQAALADDALPPFGGEPLVKDRGAVEVGAFVFKPIVEVRARGETWSDPPLGAPYAVLAPDRPTGVLDRADVLIAERSRLGIAAELGPVSAKVVIQDARQFGSTDGVFSDVYGLPSLEPHEAYLDVHTSDRQVFFRLGRQEVQLGDGRLVGISDESPKARALDAGRFGFRIKNWDIQAFAAMLAPPHLRSKDDSAGGQLYALDATWRIAPFFGAELSGLARVVRGTEEPTLSPSNTFVPWLRLFGDYRGFRYSVTGAFEGGSVAVVGDVRTQVAGGVAGRFEWETALPLHLTFGIDGAYATGRDGAEDPAKTTDHAFDPILPDTKEHFGQSGFIAWSNVISGAFDVALKPHDAVRVRAGYRFAGLAEPHGTWFSSNLTPVGLATDNDSRVLGHIVEANVQVTPWEPLTFEADYGAMILGDGGKAILAKGGSTESVLHYGLLEATARFP